MCVLVSMKQMYTILLLISNKKNCQYFAGCILLSLHKSKHMIVYLALHNIYVMDTNYQTHRIDNLTNNLFSKVFAHLYDIDCMLGHRLFGKKYIGFMVTSKLIIKIAKPSACTGKYFVIFRQ